MGDRLLSFSELRDHGVLYGRRHVDRLEHAKRFPRRVSIGDARVGWVQAEIDNWVKARIDARSDDVGTLGSTKPEEPVSVD